MSYLGKHAECYDLFYQDKSYSAEAKYVANFLRVLCPDARLILDLGCGTGLRSLELAKLGYKVSGLDQSPAMLARARQHLFDAKTIPLQAADFVLGDITSYRSDRPYDSIISLFHVFSYLTTEESLSKTIRCSFGNLRPGGVFIFDYWHGPGVLNDPPVTRTRRAASSAFRAVRTSVPQHFPDTHLVELTISLEITDKQTGLQEQVAEKYLLRYWFLDELDRQLKAAGFQDTCHYSWLTHAPPRPETWLSCTVAVKPASPS